MKKIFMIFVIISIILISIIILLFFSGFFNYENIESGLDFQSKTVDDQPHPDFVTHSVKEAPVFIAFVQNDINCLPSARMRPEIEKLIEEYDNKVIFYIINVNENKITKYYKNKEETDIISNLEENDIYNTYDIEDIGKGRPATPTFIIIIKDDSKLKFAVGYGEFENEDTSDTGQELEKTIKYALSKY